jgi:hypothetical protein
MIGNWEIAAMADALADRCEHVTIALLGWPSSASGRIRQLMAIAAPDWLHDNIHTGLSSGERVTFQVRDPSTATSFRKPRAARPDDLRQTRSISFATIQPLGSLIGGGPK